MSGREGGVERTGAARQRVDGSTGMESLVRRLTSPTAGALLVVAIVGLVVAGVSAASLQRRDPVYESSQMLLIDQPGALALAPSGDLIAKLSALRIKYVSLLHGDAVLQPAARDLGLPVAALAGSVRASAPPESLLIRITARTPQADPAPRVVQAVGSSLSHYLDEEQAALDVPAASRITLTPLRDANHAVQVEPSARRSVSLGIVGGMVAAGLVYLAFGFLPLLRRRRTTSDP